MTDEPKLKRQDLRGLANRNYIPRNSKRLEAQFGNQIGVVELIRDEIETAYEEGYWDAMQAAARERDRYKKALGWYADEYNYNALGVAVTRGRNPDSPDGPGEHWEEADYGTIAQKALAQHRDEADRGRDG